MVLILDGNSEHVAQPLRQLGLFGENKFLTAIDLIKCLKQIK